MLVRAHGTDAMKRHVEYLQNVMSMGLGPAKEALVGLDPALYTIGGTASEFNEQNRLGTEVYKTMTTNSSKDQEILKWHVVGGECDVLGEDDRAQG